MPEGSHPPHPLDGCDPTECYQTMMSERTALITARREAEDNLIKTVIQVSAALLALLAGFISQAKIELSNSTLALFGTSLLGLAIAIIAGLWEQRFASQAYLMQQKLVEDYFQKKIREFAEPLANKSVRRAQTTAFVAFVAALLCLGIFAVIEARDNMANPKGPPPSRPAPPSPPPTPPARPGHKIGDSGRSAAPTMPPPPPPIPKK